MFGFWYDLEQGDNPIINMARSFIVKQFKSKTLLSLSQTLMPLARVDIIDFKILTLICLAVRVHPYVCNVGHIY